MAATAKPGKIKTRLAHAQDATLAMFTELGWPLFTARPAACLSGPALATAA